MIRKGVTWKAQAFLTADVSMFRSIAEASKKGPAFANFGVWYLRIELTLDDILQLPSDLRSQFPDIDPNFDYYELCLELR